MMQGRLPATDAAATEYTPLDVPLPAGAYRDVPPDPEAAQFLVVFSHGLGGIRQQSYTLCERLASYGFIVVSPDHPGTTTLEFLGNFGNLAAPLLQRPRTIREAIDRVYAGVVPGLRPRTEGYAFVGHSLGAVADKLIAAAKSVGGRGCGWTALETARIEAGIPRFGADMDETNIPLECGLEARAISYQKGCYIGQEVINRIHSIGHVNRELRGLRLADDLKTLPAKGDKLFHDGREVGHITSAVHSPAFSGNLALGYVRREVNAVGTELKLRSAGNESVAKIVKVPFIAPAPDSSAAARHSTRSL